jgi:hypothetical protein
MGKQKIFDQFPAVPVILEEKFGHKDFPVDWLKVRKADHNLLLRSPGQQVYHSQCFERDNGEAVFLIYGYDEDVLVVEVDPHVDFESVTQPGHKTTEEGEQVWRRMVIQGVPEYIVEVQWDFDDDAPSRGDFGTTIIIYKIGDLCELEGQLLQTSRRHAPARAWEAAQSFSAHEGGLVIRGFLYFPASEDAGEEVVVSYRWGSSRLRVRDYL